jgi:hypothetical protein
MTRPVTFVPEPTAGFAGFITDAFNATTILLVAALGLLTILSTI